MDTSSTAIINTDIYNDHSYYDSLARMAANDNQYINAITTNQDTLVAYFYVKDRFNHRQKIPRQKLRVLSETFPVVEIGLNASLFDYSLELQKLWARSETLIIVEQDMVITRQAILRLAYCQFPACAQAYWISPASSGNTYSQLAARLGETAISWRDSWADYSGIGLVKLRSDARKNPLETVEWQAVEGNVNKNITPWTAHKWHIHWPIARHIHGFSQDYK